MDALANAAEPAPPPPPPPLPPDWLSQCQRNRKGDPLPNLANAMIALRSDPAIATCFAHDEMLCATLLMRSFAGHRETASRALTDTDVTAAQEWLQLAGLPYVGKETLHQAVDQRAHECSFHPVRDYLDALTWDKAPRLDAWLTSYLGAESTTYTRNIGPMFLTAMVARIYEPGCKADYMMVLEGPQGARKSTACGILGGQWFSENLPDVTTGKDVSQHLRGKWLLEIPEMSAMSRAEDAALKAFITRRIERYRPSYGRNEVIEKRQCLFIGTTNKDTYLRDETGGRRYWPVKVGTIDTDALERDRDQLFAEAVLRYRAGWVWWPDGGLEAAHIQPEQERRFDTDAWEPMIRDYLADKLSVLVGQVAREAVFLETARIGRADQNRITAILQRLGWQRLPKDGNGNVAWGRP